MEYDLGRLDAGTFARLASELVCSFSGIPVPESDVGKNISSVITGRIVWPRGKEDPEIWEGSIFVASVFVSNASNDAELNWSAIEKAVKNRVGSWEKDQNSMTRKGNRIEYVLYICNVDLRLSYSSRIEMKMDNLIRSRQNLKIKGCRLWDYGRISSMLDDQVGIRRRYSGLISPENVLSDLGEYAGLANQTLGEIIPRHLAMDLMADQWIRLGQLGQLNHHKLALSSVAIDLPVSEAPGSKSAAAHIISIGDRMLRADIAQKAAVPPPHLVLVGGPGQGKTTIGQLVCQVYRTFLLPTEGGLADESSDLISSVRESLIRVGLDTPRNRRWPIRIELAIYADEDARENISLLRYISKQVGYRTSDTVDHSLMREWLRCWPWLVVLDGLDEVPSQAARDSLVQRISDLLVEAAQAECDLLVVATTRPQGYSGEFSSDRYDHIRLSELEPTAAASYAKRLAEVQHASDPDLIAKLIARTRIASQEESTARLMRTPLQVTIMSLLLENQERAPRARYQLFEQYYHTIYSRESTKPGAIGRILEDLRSHIYALHDRVGLLLQVKAEQAGESDAALPQRELRELAITRLKSEGYTDIEADHLAGQVLKAVTHRLVLIVPKGQNEAGFEVRSIQEFMAARALASGRDPAIVSRLVLLIPSSHWRNTWLFSAGRIFSEREHLRRELITAVEDIDNYDIVNMVTAPGADIALDMLDDGLTTGAPALQRALARHSLALLRYPADEDLERRAGIFYRCSDDPVVREAIDQEVSDCMAVKYAKQSGAYSLLKIWAKETGSLAVRARQIVDRQNIRPRPDPSIRPWQQKKLEVAQPTTGEIVKEILDRDELDPKYRTLVESGIVGSLLKNSKDGMDKDGTDLEKVLEVPACWDVVAKIARSLLEEHPADASRLRAYLRRWRSRTPIGEKILNLTPYLNEE